MSFLNKLFSQHYMSRASDFFFKINDPWTKNGGSFSELMGPSMLLLVVLFLDEHWKQCWNLEKLSIRTRAATIH